MSQWKECQVCGDEFPEARWQLGYKCCLFCGEDVVRAERKSWTVVQEYGKGGYMFVTSDSARKVLTQTNQKNLRSDIWKAT